MPLRQPRYLLHLMAILGAWLALAPAARAQLTQPDLKKLVRDLMAEGLVKPSVPAITYDKDAILYKFGTVYVPDACWWSYPLRAQASMEGIWGSRLTPEQRQRWGPCLQRVERVIAKEIALIVD